ncbi:MAG: hypothetical protein Tsb009_10770 [Planctomycetaceae bacterium]
MMKIGSAGDHQKREALSLLLSHLPTTERDEQVTELLEAEQQQLLSLEGLLVAHSKDQVRGALLYLMQPDRCAYVWQPVVIESDDSERIADMLLSEVLQRLQQENPWIAQCLLDPHARRDRARLARNGFPHLVDLHYLSRNLSEPIWESNAPPLETMTYREENNHHRFAKILERTYIDSLDCPGVQGTRTGDDAILSHKSTGVFLPDQWTLFQIAGKDVGVLILADHPEQNAWELVYMGLVPEARGAGYGREILRLGLCAARAAGKESLCLAVDSQNHYARRVYDEAGFQLAEVRSVHAFIPPWKSANATIHKL